MFTFIFCATAFDELQLLYLLNQDVAFIEKKKKNVEKQLPSNKYGTKISQEK